MVFTAISRLDLPGFSALADCKHQIISWLQDKSITTEDKDEILKLIENEETAELRDRFYRDLEFGTGGMRGVMGMGTNRMNRYVVRRAMQGFSRFICKQGESIKKKGVAIAYDSRHHSQLFATEAACVFAANGIQVFLFPTLAPTPFLSFAIRHLGCTGGVCITASHNPKIYNGLKVYWDDGAQIIPPQDQGVLAEVFAVKGFSEARLLPFETAKEQGLIHFIGEETLAHYDKVTAALSTAPQASRAVRLVYTPLHGTGRGPVLRALKLWGFHDVFVVPEQAEPDGEFPTVAKPNPEDPEALALALQNAARLQADAVMATDPDSDRLALAVFDPILARSVFAHQAVGDYILLNGNQTGALLINSLLKNMQDAGTLNSSHKIVKTIVTTDLQEKICQSYGIQIYNTLTGFKWIAGLVRSWEEQGKTDHTYLFGTEESFGFMPANQVRDKDAVAALCQAAEMLAVAKQKKTTLCRVLLQLFERFGAWQESLVNIDLYGEEGTKRIERMMATMRKQTPTRWAEERVKEVLDFKTTEIQQRFQLPKADVLQILLEDGSKISMRPSGTEPKLKFYISVCTQNPGKNAEENYKETLQKIKSLTLDVENFVKSVP